MMSKTFNNVQSEWMDTPDELRQSIYSYLPFHKPSEGWRRIAVLDAECRQIVAEMMRLAEHFKQTVAEPRVIYLSVQEVRSRTVYIRWRRRGVKGKQSYLLLNSIEGHYFLSQQTDLARNLYIKYNQWALSLNLAHSLRLTESKRIRQYLDQLTASVA